MDSCGILTPSALHYERHHAGVPRIDPAGHRLLLHGMVDRPLIFTMDEIRRLPSISRVHFLECSGNSSGEWGEKTGRDAAQSHGLASCSEWTGAIRRSASKASELRKPSPYQAHLPDLYPLSAPYPQPG